ncbi:hypothetical protein O1W68_07735 [Rhodococcus sp. H36-A4]|uniref:hypothetical protein n=1 Tax=Rhodococcus sp. H36-A4 TaxID=3004353 RepID=UPI0022B076A4|nr:hypothetical protein [Rhodococcus sp. H36-A4]MCZ4077826.1 hypothetical protein [Rhodococcus sp. H36-A4]
MTFEKINSDNLTHEHVGKYVAFQTRYELPNGADGTTLLIGVLDSITHALHATSATVTRVSISISEDETFSRDLRNTSLKIGNSLTEVFLALAEQAKAETA